MKYATCYCKTVPKKPFYMVGYINENRELPALGIHQTPIVTASLLEIEQEYLLFISFDVCMIKRDVRVKINNQLIEKFPMLKKENITLSAIHSHSCPDGLGMSYPDLHPNISFFEQSCEAVIACVEKTFNNLKETEVKIGNTACAGYYGNRNDDTRPYNDNIQLLSFYQDKKLVGAMLSISCHSTVLGPNNRYCSYDLLGSIRQLYYEDFHVMPYVFMESAGDVSNRHYRQGDNELELKRVSEGIYEFVKKIDNSKEILLSSMSFENIDIPIVYDNTTYYSEYENLLYEAEKKINNSNNPTDVKLALTSQKKLKLKLNEKQIDFHVVIKIFNLGELKIITFPGELASSFGKLLKNSCKTNMLLITCADDHLGYFIEKEYYGKIYETIASYIPKGKVESIVEEIRKKI